MFERWSEKFYTDNFGRTYEKDVDYNEEIDWYELQALIHENEYLCNTEIIYAEEQEESSKYFVNESIPCVCENIYFSSVRSLGKHYGIAPSNIGRYLQGNLPMPKKWKKRGLRKPTTEEINYFDVRKG